MNLTIVLCVAALLAGVATLAAAAAAGPSIIGTWRTPVDNGLVRIEACGASACGHVEGSATLKGEPEELDVRNQDPALRGRPIRDLLLLQLNPRGPGKWGDGWVYDPTRGRKFKASAEVKADGRLLLTGCLAVLLCQTQAWTRVR